jgi:hypothetical protein
MHSFFVWIWNFNFDNPYIKAFDWITALATLIYGIIAKDSLILFIGVLGLVMAWYRPVSRYHRWLKSFVRKH